MFALDFSKISMIFLLISLCHSLGFIIVYLKMVGYIYIIDYYVLYKYLLLGRHTFMGVYCEKRRMPDI